MINDFILELNSFKKEIDKLAEIIKLETIEADLVKLEQELNKNNWTDIESTKEYNRLFSKRKALTDVRSDFSSLLELSNLVSQSDNPDEESYMIEEMQSIYDKLNDEVKKMTFKYLFNGEYDDNDVILSVHSGSGGKEAQDWARILLRMYLKWASGNDCQTKILDLQVGDSTGLVKSATIEIKGKNVYGKLKNENGVHRLVRVSPFDSQGRRHTSFAAVEVMPEIEPNNNIEINPKDIREDTFRSSGKGGQHVNTTDSAVRLVHIPTGIMVSCQNERSQTQNREYAMKILLSKLMAIKMQEHYDKLSEIRGEQLQINWGSQIRSYIFMPYQMVKDHRTGYETGNIDAVIDGDLNGFISKSLISNCENGTV